jgi:radical SAM superfamily enzyme YgiQ (UPF0313 family)
VDWNVIGKSCQRDGENAVIGNCQRFFKVEKTYIGVKMANLDKVHFPARSLLKDKLGRNMFAYNKNYKAGGCTVILAGRRCPFNCSFCTASLLRDFNRDSHRPHYA